MSSEIESGMAAFRMDPSTMRVIVDTHNMEKVQLRMRIEALETALKIIASGFLGDRILAEWELSDIAARALQANT